MSKYAMHQYRLLRKNGMPASQAIQSARIIDHWTDLEAEGKVKIESEPDPEHPWDVYGKPKSAAEQKRQQGYYENHWPVILSSFLKCSCCGEWKQVDSIGQCDYDDPMNPAENWYLIDLMAAAIRAMGI